MASDYDVISVQMGKIREGNIVLNIGVGLGVFASYVSRVWNAFVIGVDASVGFLESAKKRTGESGAWRRVLLLHSSADHLPLRGVCIDAAVSILSIQDLPPDVTLQVFREIRRVLTRRGRFVLVEDWAFDPKSRVEYALLELRRILDRRMGERKYRLNYKEYVEILRRAGFEIEEIRFLPRRIYPERLEAPDDRAGELLRVVREQGSSPLHVNLTLISSRVKR